MPLVKYGLDWTFTGQIWPEGIGCNPVLIDSKQVDIGIDSGSYDAGSFIVI